MGLTCSSWIHVLAEEGFNEICISSNVLPLVSGTNFATNRTVKPPMLANIKNVPEQDNHLQLTHI